MVYNNEELQKTSKHAKTLGIFTSELPDMSLISIHTDFNDVGRIQYVGFCFCFCGINISDITSFLGRNGLTERSGCPCNSLDVYID